MSTAYDQADNASTDASPARWRLVLLAFAGLLVGGVGLVAALALGAAHSPCMIVGVVDVEAAGWGDGVREGDSFTYYAATTTLSTEPLMLALRGRSGSDVAWGFWIDTIDGRFAALITRDGYLSVDGGATWREFRHIRRDANTLCVDYGEDDVKLYVNNEVAWQGAIRVGSGEWGYVEME
jgi:hypothetical protein